MNKNGAFCRLRFFNDFVCLMWGLWRVKVLPPLASGLSSTFAIIKNQRTCRHFPNRRNAWVRGRACRQIHRQMLWGSRFVLREMALLCFARRLLAFLLAFLLSWR
jgi:hypothetical protein